MCTTKMTDSAQKEITKSLSDQMLATVYGNCVGDAIGLLTEFMTKKEAQKYYGKKPKSLQYSQKVSDSHRSRWKEGDWTDDSDQMILILQSLLFKKGEVVASDFAERIFRWMRLGFPELGDYSGMGIGKTTVAVLKAPSFKTDPHQCAYTVWDSSQRNLASNGSVMRTSILGLYQWDNLDAVVKNTLEICRTTHYDPRCQASCVAVCVCIALMLQHTSQHGDKQLNTESLVSQAYEKASMVLETDQQKKELKLYMNCKNLKELKLDEAGKIGYTYKCLGSGFWALRQNDFEKAMIKLVMQGGDADTNGAVAGSLLACKLGLSAIPQPWIDGLKHREWLLDFFNRFIRLQREMKLPREDRTPNDDLDIIALRAAADEILKQRRNEVESAAAKQSENKENK